MPGPDSETGLEGTHNVQSQWVTRTDKKDLWSLLSHFSYTDLTK